MSQAYDSPSEQHGIEFMNDTDSNVLSVGISTGGQAEIKMASSQPMRHIIATTLDTKGIDQTNELIRAAGYADRIETKVEDVAGELPYEEGQFDYVYARLVLHYLSKDQLSIALGGLFRVTKPGGRLFVVVRSSESDEAKQEANIYDEVTGLTTYSTPSGHQATRYFHTPDSITAAIQTAGFSVEHTDQYDEELNSSFDRSGTWVKNNVIEVLAKKDEEKL